MSELDARAHRLLHVFSIVVGWVALASAALVIAGGWVAGLDALKSVLPGFATMKVNAALGIGMLGAALALTAMDARYRPIGNLLASVALLVGVVTLAEHTFDWDAGVDELFVKDFAAPVTGAPGRPAAATAMMIALLGAALLLRGRAALARAKTSAAVAASLIAWATVNGYVFGPQALHEVPLFSSVALHSAAVLLLLGVAVLAADPVSWPIRVAMASGTGGVICRWLLPPAVLAPPILGWFLSREALLDPLPTPFRWALYSAISTLGSMWLIAALAHRIAIIDAQRSAAAQLSQELREALSEREMFRAVIENSSDFIGIADAEGVPVYLNPAGRRMVGLDAGFPIGRLEVEDCYPPGLRAFASNVILDAMRTQGRWEGETFFHNFTTQEPIPVSDTHFLVHESGTDRILGSATITRDISEIKRARDERDATNRQLEDTNLRLERAIQARDEVLGIVAHDLRNPLNTILLQAGLLKPAQAARDGRSSEPAEVIRRCARRMNRLIQDLLDVARVEAGCLTVERDRVSTRQLLADSLQAHRALAAARSIELQLAAAHDLPDVWADQDRLLQVLENLLSNGIKFTSPGGRITAGAWPGDGEVLFSVADTGVGINAEDLQHIFDRFWQARRGERQGTGLGLAIVKGIVEAHDGRVWVVSAAGQGTTFFFTIPTDAPRANT